MESTPEYAWGEEEGPRGGEGKRERVLACPGERRRQVGAHPSDPPFTRRPLGQPLFLINLPRLSHLVYGFPSPFWRREAHGGPRPCDRSTTLLAVWAQIWPTANSPLSLSLSRYSTPQRYTQNMLSRLYLVRLALPIEATSPCVVLTPSSPSLSSVWA